MAARSSCALPKCTLHAPPTGRSSTGTPAAAAVGERPALQHAAQADSAAAVAAVLDDWESAIIWDSSKGAAGTGALGPVVQEEEEEEEEEAAAGMFLASIVGQAPVWQLYWQLSWQLAALYAAEPHLSLTQAASAQTFQAV